ncbi:hypothetical protein EMIT0111MI5_70073 [Burkholderia sp. IT-111MI5]
MNARQVLISQYVQTGNRCRWCFISVGALRKASAQSRKYAAKVARTLNALSEKNSTLAEKSKVDMRAPDRRSRIRRVPAVPAPRGAMPCDDGQDACRAGLACSPVRTRKPRPPFGTK